MPWGTGRLGGRRWTAVCFSLSSLLSVVASYEIAIEHVDDLTLFLILLPVPGSFTNGVLGLFTK